MIQSCNLESGAELGNTHKRSLYLPVRKEKINKITKTPVVIKEVDILPFQ